MKVHLALFHFGALVALMGLPLNWNAAARSPPTSPQSQPGQAAPSTRSSTANARVYHIELKTQRDCPHGDCPYRLSPANFSISYKGILYPLQVVSPLPTHPASGQEFPTHLLAVFPLGTLRPKDSSLADRFSRVLSQGWLVSVSRADGSFTPYCADAASLNASLKATPAVPLAAERELRESQQASTLLESFPGHRVLLLGGSRGRSDALPDWAAPLARAGVPVYFVDGGHQVLVYYDESWGGLTRGEAPAGGDYLPKRKPFTADGVMHEVKVAAALKDALKESRYYSDLKFEIPESQPEPATPITFSVFRVKGFIPYDPRPDLYVVAEENVDGKPFSARVTPPQKLSLEIDDCANPQIPCPSPPRVRR